MERYLIERVKLETETLGSMYHKATREMVCKTMELPWRNNASSLDPNKASCIPNGIYIVHKMPPDERRDYGYFRFEHVPGRNIDPVTGWSRILIHKITYVKDLLGCIGIGGRHTDLNKDGVPDMVDSTKKMDWLFLHLPDVFELEIIDRP